MSEYNIQMNKYNALNAEYDQLYPATKIKNVNGLDTALQNNDPRQWGLGTVGKRLYSSDDLNTIWKSGFYSWGGSDKPTNFIENAPSAFWVSAMEVISYGDGGVNIQRVWGLDTASAPILVQRVKYGNTIRPWEYVNPPMSLGEEYRTTERFNGKPVYVKTIASGAMPAAAGFANRIYVDSTVKKNDVDTMIEWRGRVSSGAHHFFLPVNTHNDSVINLTGYLTEYTNYGVYIEASDDYSAYSGTLTFKYTKKSD